MDNPKIHSLNILSAAGTKLENFRARLKQKIVSVKIKVKTIVRDLVETNIKIQKVKSKLITFLSKITPCKTLREQLA